MINSCSYIPEDLISDYCEARLSLPVPVKLFMGLIFSKKIDLEVLKQKLGDTFGQLGPESQIRAFDHTDYYNREMGTDLMRCFLGFKTCVNPDSLAGIKHITNRIEMQMGKLEGRKIFRMINLDPGILSLSNVVLATTKNRAHRIYLGKGIYAEVTLLYSKAKGWCPLEWTYPDYRTPVANEFFQTLRNDYFLQIKNHPGDPALSLDFLSLDKIKSQD